MPASLTDTRSQELFARAKQSLVGGVNSPVRAMRGIGRNPIFIDRAEGTHVFDVDGNAYVDYLASWGPAILGHAPPVVIDDLRDALARGTSYGAPTEREIVFAEAIRDAMPSIERLRMTSSGSEAVMGAVRLARAATGREVIVKTEGGYHGAIDGLLAQAGSGATTLGVPTSPGVTAGATAATRLVPYNDLAAAEVALEGAAAIILEPVAGNMGVVPPAPGYLEGLRAACDRTGALLILDEVITGFRVARGGAQERFGVKADLTCMGKVIGGGLPVGAFGGRADVMRELAPEGPCYQAGTLSGNPLATTAGLAVICRLAAEGTYEQLEENGARLEAVIRDSGAPVTVQRVGSMLTPFFTDSPVTNYAEATACDTDAYAQLARGLLANGVYPPPSQFEAWFTSTIHGDDEFRATEQAFARVLEGMA
ncbi:MAG: glutamate-1-semialdehyde 2,1-aminomutase [Actinobacteria bacterium]|nr:glutamate-1-semialdehyde 2,1-aminomutase [Actinomycetota bacterium]